MWPFGCRHKNISYPFTLKGIQRKGIEFSAAIKKFGSYVVCLDCGKEFAYDWNKMEIVKNEKSFDSKS